MEIVIKDISRLEEVARSKKTLNHQCGPPRPSGSPPKAKFEYTKFKFWAKYGTPNWNGMK